MCGPRTPAAAAPVSAVGCSFRSRPHEQSLIRGNRLPASQLRPASWLAAPRHSTAAAVAATPPAAASSAAAMGSQAAAAELSSMQHLPQRYRGLLLDQFGVLHDGERPYEGAVEAVARLAASGLKMLIISNSSRRKCPCPCCLCSGHHHPSRIHALTCTHICNRPNRFKPQAPRAR